MQAFSIGHSRHTWPHFQSLIEQHRIGCVADVRSYPRSRLPYFSTPSLRVLLNRVGVSYVWLGDQLGGRPRSGPTLYSEIALTPHFRTGIERLLEIAGRTRVAMLCSEAQVLDCHRFNLLSRHLTELGVEVVHIHPDGTTESQFDAEERLMTRRKVPADLLMGRQERLAIAYHRQEQRLRGESAS